MAESKIFLQENKQRIERSYLEQAKSLPRVFEAIDRKLAEWKWLWHANIFMHLCHTVISEIIHLKCFWIMR